MMISCSNPTMTCFVSWVDEYIIWLQLSQIHCIMMIIQSMMLVSSMFLTLFLVIPTYQQLPQQLQGYRMEQALQVVLLLDLNTLNTFQSIISQTPP